jgi:hypothetical protein
MTDMQDIASAPKDQTIIVTGGWYENPNSGQRVDFVPSFVAWDAGQEAWIMQDDHKLVYHEPKRWVSP